LEGLIIKISNSNWKISTAFPSLGYVNKKTCFTCCDEFAPNDEISELKILELHVSEKKSIPLGKSAEKD
jgi:hypothetical protein